MSEQPPIAEKDAGRRAKVNGQPGGTIAWSEHVKAWESYHRNHPGQSAERINERGGFGLIELVQQLGHMPLTWEPNEQTRFIDRYVTSPTGKCWRHDYEHREYVCTCVTPPPTCTERGCFADDPPCYSDPSCTRVPSPAGRRA